MPIVFKCNNSRCEYAPCFASCRKAANYNDFGDGAIETPDSCPFMELSGECSEFKFVNHGYQPDYAGLSQLEDWYFSNNGDLPEDLQNAIDNCEFYGDLAQTDYRTVCKFANLMRYEAEDPDRWSLSERVEELCKKFKKREILIAALESGYRIGLMQAAKIMKESENESKGEQ